MLLVQHLIKELWLGCTIVVYIKTTDNLCQMFDLAGKVISLL